MFKRIKLKFQEIFQGWPGSAFKVDRPAAFLLGLCAGALLTLAILETDTIIRAFRSSDSEETPVEQTTPDLVLHTNPRINARIKYYLRASHKADLLSSYKRAGLYMPMIRAIFEEYNLPPSLIYLPLLESRFIPTRRSHAGAVGLWQLMPATATQLGLKRNRWLDERRDPEKSTIVAAEYLSYLHGKLRNWDLALAAYNCGLGRLRRAMRRDQTVDFWKLKSLPRETRLFVPSFYAMLHLLRNTEANGVSLPEPDKPLDYESIELETTFSIKQLGALTGISEKLIRQYNPALLGSIAPQGTYSLRVPEGFKETFTKNLQNGHAEQIELTYATHVIRRGETLAKIAHRYGTTVSAIMADNNLRSSRWIKAGKKLRIASVTINRVESEKTAAKEIAITEETVTENKVRFVYKVEREGLSIAVLARYYAVQEDELRGWNPALQSDKLKAGAELSIYKSAKDVAFHRTRRGDSLWKLAKKYGTSIRNLKRWNQLSDSRIYPGSELIVSLD